MGAFDWVGDAIGGAASLLGGERANSANAAASREQMEFQKKMSGTAYRRAMHDMKLAGLNPILAGKLGGASTPGGSMPVLHDTITPAVNTALQTAGTMADVKLKTATTVLTEAKSVLSEALIPGAKTVEKITTQLNNLAEAMADLYGKDKAGYTETLLQLQAVFSDTLKTAQKMGMEVSEWIKGQGKYHPGASGPPNIVPDGGIKNWKNRSK